MMKKVVRKKPSTGGAGKFYRIELSPGSKFKMYRNQDVGGKGGLERVAGKTANNAWKTAAWLVSKTGAKVKDGKLVITDPKMKTLLKSISSSIEHVKGDIFKGKAKKKVAKR